MESAVEAVREVIEKETTDQRAFIFGWSMGAYVAYAFLRKYPELCRGLIAGGAYNTSFGSMSKIFFKGIGAIYKVMPYSSQWKLIPRTFKTIPKENFEFTFLRSGLDYDKWNDCVNCMLEPEENFFLSGIKNYKGPILFMHGTGDTMQKKTQLFWDASDNKEVFVIPDATHVALIHPAFRDHFTDKLAEFVEKVESGTFVPQKTPKPTASTATDTEEVDEPDEEQPVLAGTEDAAEDAE
eukprot:TRINITY_DN27478_c0_g2_i1.p1 TRINITY_DN27478_c0_g2~~TRINITY_DN27478_c0_g2_i1.p1  ORF type:complete len:264 (-),score=37.87 TRINITY_DN27478_c0_g2_i1:171-887(-)